MALALAFSMQPNNVGSEQIAPIFDNNAKVGLRHANTAEESYFRES